MLQSSFFFFFFFKVHIKYSVAEPLIYVFNRGLHPHLWLINESAEFRCTCLVGGGGRLLGILFLIIVRTIFLFKHFFINSDLAVF